jgi:hypothetical protein
LIPSGGRKATSSGPCRGSPIAICKLAITNLFDVATAYFDRINKLKLDLKVYGGEVRPPN